MQSTTRTRRPFWQSTMFQLAGITGLVAGLYFLWRPEPSEAQKHERQRIKNEQLYDAVANRMLDDVRRLLDAGAYENYSREIENTTIELNGRANRESVLNLSIRLGDIECMKLLLERGANARLKFPAEAAEVVFKTDLEAQHKSTMLQVLIAHDSNSRDRRYMDLAIENNEPEVALTLYELGFAYDVREHALAGDPEKLRTAEANTPGVINRPVAVYRECRSLLGIALLRRHQEVADWLLGAGSSIDILDEHQGNAMHLAALGKCDWIMTKLREAGCDPDATNDRNETPLTISIANAPPPTVKAVIEAGADPTPLYPDQVSLWSQIVRRVSSNRRDPAGTSILVIMLTAGFRPPAGDWDLRWLSQNEPAIRQLLHELGIEVDGE